MGSWEDQSYHGGISSIVGEEHIFALFAYLEEGRGERVVGNRGDCFAVYEILSKWRVPRKQKREKGNAFD